MIEWFKKLSATWKIGLALIAFLIAIFIFDSFTGYVREAKNYIFDRDMAKIEQQNQQLLDENAKLRSEQQELIKQATEAKAKEAVFEDRAKNLDAKTRKKVFYNIRLAERSNDPKLFKKLQMKYGNLGFGFQTNR